MKNQKGNEASGFTDHKSDFPVYLKDEFLPPLQGGNSILQPVRRHGKLFFIKRLKPDLKQQSLWADSLKREFEVGYTLDHPHIVRYIDQGSDQDGAFIVIEYIDGISLSNYLSKHNNIPEKLILQWLHELLSALAYMHSKQVYHGDLKPDNLLITHKGAHLKMIDFGHVNQDSYRFKAGGSKEFSAPEQYLDAQSTGPASDLYAAGKIAACMLGHQSISSPAAKAIASFAENCTQNEMSARPQNATEAAALLEIRSDFKPLQTGLMVVVIFLLAAAVLPVYFSSIRNDTKNIKSLSEPKAIKESESTQPENRIPVQQAVNTVSYPDSAEAAGIGQSAYLLYQLKIEDLDRYHIDSAYLFRKELISNIQRQWKRRTEGLDHSSEKYQFAAAVFKKELKISELRMMAREAEGVPLSNSDSLYISSLGREWYAIFERNRAKHSSPTTLRKVCSEARDSLNLRCFVFSSRFPPQSDTYYKIQRIYQAEIRISEKKIKSAMERLEH